MHTKRGTAKHGQCFFSTIRNDNNEALQHSMPKPKFTHTLNLMNICNMY